MLQIDHIYEFLSNTVFKDFSVFTLPKGVPEIKEVLTKKDMYIFTSDNSNKKIFSWDQEPLIDDLTTQYYHEIFKKYHTNEIETALITSEISELSKNFAKKYNLHSLYYFFHGFAALDWYRGYYALNYNKPVVYKRKNDYISFNRIVTEDRSYRIYFISQLIKAGILNVESNVKGSKGLVSFGVEDTANYWQWRNELDKNSNSKLSDTAKYEILKYLSLAPERFTIDNIQIPGSASANIVRNSPIFNVDAFWHVVTETVFYYDKLHLTEKIFKPIVSKQPFMLLAAPGNLAYLKSYGFKTFDSVINETYDTIKDHDLRINSVVQQLNWYCNLSDSDKLDVMKKLEPIIEYNFHHFYGKFKEIIVDELITNCENLFTEIDYQHDVDFDLIKKILLN